MQHFFLQYQKLNEEDTDTASENEDSECYPTLLMTLENEQMWKTYTVTNEQINQLEMTTREQSISPLWYAHRKGRITGTKAHAVLTRRNDTPPENLTMRIMDYKSYDLSGKKEIRWGLDNEDLAREKFVALMSSTHNSFNCRKAGFIISKQMPFLGASPDGVIECQCCGRGVLEIKCPFKYKSSLLADVINTDGTFFIDCNKKLKSKHKYYTQVQMEMFVAKVNYCYLVVLMKDLTVIRIEFDKIFCETLLPKCESLFVNYVLPELFTGKLETKEPIAETNENVAEVWCLCRESEYGKMICCDNEQCEYVWFHYRCVNIIRKPRGQWFCPKCS